MGVDGFGFFVERLLIRIGPVDEQGDAVCVAKAIAAIGVLGRFFAGTIGGSRTTRHAAAPGNA